MQTAQFALHASLEDRHWWFVARRRIVRSLIDHFLSPTDAVRQAADVDAVKSYVSPDDRRRPLIIDVGCGTGGNIASLADAYRVAGIDSSADAIQWARQRFPNINFIEGYAPKDLGPLMQEARLITLMDVLEHVPDDFHLLSSLLAAASPGTYFIVTVPADQSLWSKHDETFGHYRRYDLERFKRLWAGLAVETHLVTYYNSRLYPLVKAVRKFNRLLRRSSGASGTDFKMPSHPVNWMFESIFAGEGEMLFGTLKHEQEGYERGVSLIAVLQRQAGRLQPRTKPIDAVLDYFDPTEGRRIKAKR
jgi:2-polyprenyl-3-methyl-5-hydroxy-6-metoxy-1,4-benzoquinol methylase